jgi:hypothetical protein
LQLHLESTDYFTGELFIAALLDTFPNLEPLATQAVEAIDVAYPVTCLLLPCADGDDSGSQFQIESFAKVFGNIPYAFPESANGDLLSHEAGSWELLGKRLASAGLQSGTRQHALAMFDFLIERPSESPATGQWQSVALIAAAAALIDALGTVQWTAAVSADQVSPTGSALLRHLRPRSITPEAASRSERTLVRSGIGFAPAGARGSNARLRVLCFKGADEGGAEEESPLVQDNRPGAGPPMNQYAT